MRILVVDGQGGGVGKQLVTNLKAKFPDLTVVAIGTNALATSNMLRAGADEAATGENAVVVQARRVDLITGPIGIVIADALLGEITPKMAVALGQSAAVRVLVPMNHCENIVAGVQDGNMTRLIESAVTQIGKLLQGESGFLPIRK